MHERTFCILLVKVCFICVEVVHVLQPVQKGLIHVCTCPRKGMHTHMYMYYSTMYVLSIPLHAITTNLCDISQLRSSVHVCTHAYVVLGSYYIHVAIVVFLIYILGQAWLASTFVSKH